MTSRPPDDVYRQLQRHLDHSPVPFPATESGVEIRILKQLFTPEEARIALWLSAIPESLDAIHRRAQEEVSREELRTALDAMAGRGAIQKFGGAYGKAPLVVGMYEAQVNRLTPELERDFREYLYGEFGKAVFSDARTPQMRTVPVNKSIDVEHPVASYNDIRAYAAAHPGPFAALDCICRQGKVLTGGSCQQTSEKQSCLMFGAAAEVTVAKAGARAISKDEMLALLDQADRDGLVLQPQNTQEPLFVCCCCGCCCGVLTAAKKLPRPADFFQTDFIAEVNGELCQVCGACGPRCQMDAIASGDGPAEVVEERCIGCGLCVTTCPSGALSLRKKEGKKAPPKHIKALYLRMFQERYGVTGAAAALAGHMVGRKF